jgi:hypothetical protein
MMQTRYRWAPAMLAAAPAMLVTLYAFTATDALRTILGALVFSALLYAVYYFAFQLARKKDWTFVVLLLFSPIISLVTPLVTCGSTNNVCENFGFFVLIMVYGVMAIITGIIAFVLCTELAKS